MDGGSRSWQPTGFGERMTSHNNQKNANFTSNRPSQHDECKVYVKNVPLDMTRESLEGLFSTCGNVVSTHILNPKEGRNSTIGFVKYTSDEEVLSAIERLNGTQLGQSCLVVERAVQKDRARIPVRNQEQEYQRRDFQNVTGNENGYPSYEGYRPQTEQPPRDNNMQKTFQAPEMNNGNVGMGARQEEAIFNPRGPGRGGVQNSHLLPQHPMVGQQRYRQPSEMNYQQEAVGVRREEAVFNPRGPGRGGGMINQNTQSFAPGQNSSYMNGIANESSYDPAHGNPPLWTSDSHQQYTTRSAVDLQQQMNVTGRLPDEAFPEDIPQITNGSQSFQRRGEIDHFAREWPNKSPEQHTEREPVKRLPPVTYIPPELPEDINELFQDAPHSGLNFDKYDAIPVNVTGKEIPPAISTFDEAGILDQCAANIKRAQFTKPTPIQKHAIPITLAGRDLMACAQTGSGKTVAYLLPVLTGLIRRGLLDGGGYLSGETQSPAALCLAPTRELAVQIHKEVCKFAYETVINAKVCYGGVSVQHQLDKIRRGCHFLIATPGRLIDFVERNRVSLANVQYLILDEADRMLDMGFENDVRRIVTGLGMPDKMHRQTLMYSATFPDEIQRLAADFLKETYLFVAVGTVGGSNLDISQTVITVSRDEKQEKLFEILLNSGTDRTLIFVELKRVADFLACLLSENNFPTTSISGDRTQQEREAALRDFRTGRAPVLVATSVAARGLDIPDVKHVINYDLPQEIDEYVHRIGRTGRIGNKGKATSFFQPGKDEKVARSLVKVLSQADQVVPDWLEHAAEEAVGSSYGPAGGKFASKDRRERDRHRGSTYAQPRMSGPVNGIDTVTKSMERVSIQPPMAINPAGNSCNQDEEEWD